MGRIEPGCLAIVINSEAGNSGLCVTVVKYLGEVEGFRLNDQWEIDKHLQTLYGNIANHCGESQLMRIDDFEGDKQNEVPVKIKQKKPIVEPVQIPS